MKILWISLETTGLDLSIDEVIRISAFLEIDKQIKDLCLDLKIRPNIEAAKRYLTGGYATFAPQELASEAFCDISTIYTLFTQFLSAFVDKFDSNDKFYIGTYNSEFVVNFLRKFFKDNNDEFYGSWFNQKTIDVMHLVPIVEYYSKQRFPDIKLQTVYDNLAMQNILQPMSTMPDHGEEYKLPDKVKQSKLVFDGLMKHLTDIPY